MFISYHKSVKDTIQMIDSGSLIIPELVKENWLEGRKYRAPFLLNLLRAGVPISPVYTYEDEIHNWQVISGYELPVCLYLYIRV